MPHRDTAWRWRLDRYSSRRPRQDDLQTQRRWPTHSRPQHDRRRQTIEAQETKAQSTHHAPYRRLADNTLINPADPNKPGSPLSPPPQPPHHPDQQQKNQQRPRTHGKFSSREHNNVSHPPPPRPLVVSPQLPSSASHPIPSPLVSSPLASPWCAALRGQPRIPHRPREPEVGQLERGVVLLAHEQQILGLQVPVGDVSVVAVLDGVEQHLEDVPGRTDKT